MGCTLLRPSNFMTNALWWAAAIRAEGVVRDPVGPGRLSLIDPADITAVVAAALTEDGHVGQAYVLTGGELLTVKQQTQILSDVLGGRSSTSSRHRSRPPTCCWRRARPLSWWPRHVTSTSCFEPTGPRS
jgi:uncharacterized protein YbjT (DUF2867 family)